MKCLPTSKLPFAQGNVLHDSHAEIISIRAFNRFLVDECSRIIHSEGISSFIRRRSAHEITTSSSQAFTVIENVSIHMYSSEAPCGDASMELIMAAQEDATPWEVPAIPTSSEDAATLESLKGRGSFAELGIVRRKPARPDAPPTLSKSCTDKLTMYQYTSVLGSLASVLISPENAYLSTLTIPESQYVQGAIARAFTTTGRLPDLAPHIAQHWSGSGYSFNPFHVQATSLEFAWSRRSAAADQTLSPSNVTAVYTPNIQESLINGVLQGRKIFDRRGASAISRKAMWLAVSNLFPDEYEDQTYHEVKEGDACQSRRAIKADVQKYALLGWTKNLGDEHFRKD